MLKITQMITSLSLAHVLRELLYNSRTQYIKIWDIKNVQDMYKNCGLTCIRVVQDLTNLCMQSNAEAAEYKSPLTFYVSNNPF
jgi:hypothetical protein